MDKTLFEKFTLKIIDYVNNINYSADEKDIYRNKVNYGVVTAYADVLIEFGHKVVISSVYNDDGYLRIDRVVIGSETYQFKHYDNECVSIDFIERGISERVISNHKKQ